MKLFFCVLISFLFVSNSLADDKYQKAIKKNLSKMDTTNTAEGFVEAANGFERIALAEKDKWLPYYYVSFCYILASYSEKVNTAKDAFLDKAFSFGSVADSLDPDNSEVFTLYGMIAQGRMQIDPMNRWMKYGPEADKNFNKAKELDTLNPRPDYLIGTGLFYTPEQFGGGPVTAKPILEKSLDKYNKFVPENDIAPNWGREMLEGMLKKINEG